jgi:hypothetical protein
MTKILSTSVLLSPVFSVFLDFFEPEAVTNATDKIFEVEEGTEWLMWVAVLVLRR